MKRRFPKHEGLIMSIKTKEKSWDCCGVEWAVSRKHCLCCGEAQPPAPKCGRPLKYSAPAVRVSVRLDPNDIAKLVKMYGTACEGIQEIIHSTMRGGKNGPQKA